MSHVFHGHEEVIAEMRKSVPEGGAIQIPPAAFKTLGTEFLEYAPGGVLKAAFPAVPALANPLGVFLGAGIGAAMDVLFGSLAYLETRQACTTVTMESTFIRPIVADGQRFRCEVNIRAKTKRFVFLEGRAFTADNKLAMTSTSTMVLL